MLFLILLFILISNWVFANLLGFFPVSLFQSLGFLLKYEIIAVIIIIFSWSFGDE